VVTRRWFAVVWSVIALVWGPGGTFAEGPAGRIHMIRPMADEAFTAAGTNTDQAPDISPILYVNGCFSGCEYTPALRNDARIDESTLIDHATTLTPFVHGPEVWDATIECLREVYRPYAVHIVTEDPGMEDHHEAVLAGLPAQLGLPASVVGIAPVSADCSPKDNVISFNFANALDPNPDQLCWTVAQESAHAYGLDHVLSCFDPMTYNPACGRKYFRDRFLSCGEYAERLCRCGDDGQNSHRALVQLFGPGEPPPPPHVHIELPKDGDIVAESFAVYVTATDPRLIDRVELWVNGSLYYTLPGLSYANRDQPHIFVLEGLAMSILDLEVRGFNSLGVVATDAVTVARGGPCESPCGPGQECRDGRCREVQAAGDLGTGCLSAGDCQSKLCAQNDGQRRCSSYCAIGVRGQCPGEFTCVPGDKDRSVCWPQALRDSGDQTMDGAQPADGCTVDGPNPWNNGVGWGLAAALGLLWRRRRWVGSTPAEPRVTAAGASALQGGRSPCAAPAGDTPYAR